MPSLVVCRITLGAGHQPTGSEVRKLQGRSRIPFKFILILAATLTSCGEIVNYPAPTITALSPTSVPAGQPTFTIQVKGSNFVPQSEVEWNGSVLVTFFGTTNQLTATVPASFIQNPGTVEISVFTPQPGGGTTPTSLEFDIKPALSPVPQITYLSPAEVYAGSGTLTLYVAGKDFVSLSTVTVNGNNRATTFNNSTSLLATITAQDIASSGALQIAVLNPPPGGGSSNSVPLNITNATPIVSAVSPTSVQAGSAAATLTVSGSSFVPNSVIYINGAPRATTFSSSSSISATLTLGDLSSAGIDQVWVFNPSPRGGTSNTLTLAVNATDTAGLPLLVDVAPDGTQASNGICGGLVNCQNGTFGLTVANSGPSVSTKGEFIAFASISGNLVTGIERHLLPRHLPWRWVVHAGNDFDQQSYRRNSVQWVEFRAIHGRSCGFCRFHVTGHKSGYVCGGATGGAPSVLDSCLPHYDSLRHEHNHAARLHICRWSKRRERR